MTSPPPARRRRFAVDIRLLIGIGLVALSVAGVMSIVSAADRRVTVYVAADTLAPGDRVEPDQLLARRVNLDDAQALYLSAGDLPDDGLIATAVVRRGELVPISAVATAGSNRSTSIVLELAGEVSASVVPGALVDIWSSATVSGDGTVGSSAGFGPPTVLTADAIVVRVIEPDGIVSAADGRSVEVQVPRYRIARLLQAIANGDALAVVPAGIPLTPR
ncbi:MAG: hypothetical protein ABI566_12000 [Pseudolysinimonas sp.]